MPADFTIAERGASWARRSVTLKLFIIGGLTVVLLVPLLMLRGLISERQNMREQAVRSVSASWGQAQAVGGPVLTVPLVRGDSAAGAVHFLPDRLEIDGTVTPQVRERGLFRVLLYTTTLRVRATFARPSVAGLALGRAALRPDLATLALGLTDVRGVQQAIRVQWTPVGGTLQNLEARPGLPSYAPYNAGVHVPVALSETDTSYTFETTLVIGGAESLAFLPLGKETKVHLRGPHGPVGFTGAALPRTSTATDDAFEANWSVLAYNRGFEQRFLAPTMLALGIPSGTTSETYVEVAPMRDGGGSSGGYLGGGDTFGVTLRDAVDPYQQSMRTAEYGLLFVLLTFATFFFVETLGNRRVHPVQYLLVGFAVCLFYLMLLAFSEYLAFNVAYFLAAVAILALVLLYGKAIFGDWRTAGTVAGVLALFYAYFFVLLQLEEFALLAGSLGLFVILAAVMYLSRRVDWYGLGGGKEGPTPTSGTMVPAVTTVSTSAPVPPDAATPTGA